MTTPSRQNSLLEAVFEASPFGLAVYDASMRFVRVNAVFAAIHGLPVDVYIGRTLRDVLPALAPDVEPVVARALAGEVVRDVPLSGETAAQPGVRRHWNASYLPITVDGEAGVAVFVEERTAQVEAQRALRESEARFRAIAASSPIGIILSDVDSRLVYANAATERMAGVSSEALQGFGWSNVVHPEDLPRLQQLITESIRTQAGGYSISLRLQRPEGDVLWVDVLARDFVQDGVRTGRLTLVIDHTETRRMEAALLESEERFRELAENVDAVFYLARPDGSVEYVSPGFASIWGLSPEALYANPRLWLESMHADDRERVRQLVQRDRVRFRAEYRIVRPDGEVRWISDRSFPVLDAAGEVRRVAGVATDDTLRHSLEAQLLQAQRLESIGRLAGGVAHDFNNLLTVILSHAAFARQDVSQAGEDLSAIEQAGVRASELTAQLLAFARRQVIEPRIVDLNALTGQVDRMLRRLIGAHVQLQTVCADALWPVRVDPAQMEQVLVNLAVNARDAMPDGGTLIIETANVVLDEGYAAAHAGVTPGEYVMLAVSDSGKGIEAHVLPMVFEPFYTTKPSGSGTGLGLATCYGIVKQAGGHIWAYSEPGNGASFKIYLPRGTGTPSELAPAEAATPQRGYETVLLVEDDEDVRAIAVRTLREQGFTVLEAYDGEDALQVAGAHAGEIHILVTDVVMPRLGGKELAAKLSAERPSMKVLFASGYTRNAIVHQGVLEDGIHFLQKPYVPATLTRRVRDVLDGAGDTPP
ncbi:MAG: PAS domain S-box protein [Gemmatimonadaceae bacterium]|nr:PAS domain S-box protein [Gemmatimonadaceae bacterium]